MRTASAPAPITKDLCPRGGWGGGGGGGGGACQGRLVATDLLKSSITTKNSLSR